MFGFYSYIYLRKEKVNIFVDLSFSDLLDLRSAGERLFCEE